MSQYLWKMHKLDVSKHAVATTNVIFTTPFTTTSLVIRQKIICFISCTKFQYEDTNSSYTAKGTFCFALANKLWFFVEKAFLQSHIKISYPTWYSLSGATTNIWGTMCHPYQSSMLYLCHHHKTFRDNLIYKAYFQNSRASVPNVCLLWRQN